MSFSSSFSCFGSLSPLLQVAFQQKSSYKPTLFYILNSKQTHFVMLIKIINHLEAKMPDILAKSKLNVGLNFTRWPETRL